MNPRLRASSRSSRASRLKKAQNRLSPKNRDSDILNKRNGKDVKDDDNSRRKQQDKRFMVIFLPQGIPSPRHYRNHMHRQEIDRHHDHPGRNVIRFPEGRPDNIGKKDQKR